MLTDVTGVRVGHWSDPVGRTGCTVALFPAGTVASGEIRGGAPGTREWELLDPARLVGHLDAVVLCGGSAFGLAACDGVMAWCEERGLGVPTAAGPVPIVVGAVLYDMAVGDARARPDAGAGRRACELATAGSFATGAVGAGTGATVGNWRGPSHVRAGGLGTATVRGPGGVVVSALVACNAWGDLREAEPGDGGAGPPDGPEGGDVVWDAGALTNTTIGVIATTAALTKAECLLVAHSGHDGLARALDPVHAAVDGDGLVVAATGADALAAAGAERVLAVEGVRRMAAHAVERAVRQGVRAGQDSGAGPAGAAAGRREDGPRRGRH